MMLRGYSPDMIFEVMAKGLQFWSFQTYLQSMYQQSGIEQLKLRLADRESILEKIKLNIKHHIMKEEKRINALQKEVEALTNSLKNTETQLNEKNRQLFNLESRYDQLRRQSLASMLHKDIEPMDSEPPHFKEFRTLTNRERAPATQSFHMMRQDGRHNILQSARGLAASRYRMASD